MANMRVVIIEDELPAAEKLERYLQKYDSNIVVIKHIDSVTVAIPWLRDNQDNIDLIFMDIQLIDGLSFQIFQQVQVKKPVIFTTAYNEYALDAFKVNSIDYLLKPITFTDLATSLQKLASLREQLRSPEDQSQRIQQAINSGNSGTHKKRFMVKIGEHIRSITSDQIVMLYAEGRDVYLVTTQSKKFIIDYTLETLEDILDPHIFFRINRTFILNINAIKDVLVYSNSRLKITMTSDFDKEIIVSREKVNDFKTWFDGNH
jgi:two-component system, LytTR family, response regulator